MNIIFLKGLIFSLAIHTFVISLFFHGNNFKKSETSMTEIIILSSNENDSLKRKKLKLSRFYYQPSYFKNINKFLKKVF